MIQRIPHTLSNKIDRKALAEIYQNVDISSWENSVNTSTSVREVSDDPALAETIDKLGAAVAELTGVSPSSIEPTTHLSALGVDSVGFAPNLVDALIVSHYCQLRAIQLSARLRELKIDAAVVDILQQSTLRKLASVIHERQVNIKFKSNVDRSQVQRQMLLKFDARWRPQIQNKYENVERVLPCMPCKPITYAVTLPPLTQSFVVQEGLVSENLRDPETYWAHHCYKLKEGVDLDRLHTAWEGVAFGREILRTGFASTAQINPGESTSA
jgi:ferricrocin synthase